MTHGRPLASGRDADVYALGDHKVLRRYRDGGDVTVEAEVMRYVGGLGYPIPVVYETDGADLVMERLDGNTMTHALLSGSLDLAAGGAMLADLHSRLHALPALLSAAPEVRILHLDLHPDNVMLTSKGPVVIDWRNTAEGDPDEDLALTALILAQAGVGDAAEIASAARVVLTAFLGQAGGNPLRKLDRAVEFRSDDPAQTALEVTSLARAAALVRQSA